MNGTSGTSRRSRTVLWRLVAAWSAVVALAVVAAAPLWHDHSHGHAAAAGQTHTDGACCTHEHGKAPPASAPAHDPSPAPDEHDTCAICLAMNAPTGDGLPSLALFDVPVVAELLRRLGAERPAVEWVGCDRASRGPPLAVSVG